MRYSSQEGWALSREKIWLTHFKHLGASIGTMTNLVCQAVTCSLLSFT